MSIKRLIAMGLAASVLMTAATGCGKAADTGSAAEKPAGTTATADSGTNAAGTTATDTGSQSAAGAASTTPNDAGSVTSSETPIEEPSPSPGKEEVNDSSNETSDSAAYTKEKAAAISALTNRQKSERDTVYVYKDFSKTANHFTQKAKMAGKDDSLVKDMDENWQEDPYSGTSCIRCEVSTRIEDWGGWLFLNGYLPKGETVPLLNDGSMDGQGLDLTGATELRFMAKGDRCGEKVEFFTAGSAMF